MARSREAALVAAVVALALLAAACTVSTEDLAVAVDVAPTATPVPPPPSPSSAPATPTPTLPPDFEFSLDPQGLDEDPPPELGLGEVPGIDPGPPTGYLGLCGALADIVGDTVNDVDAAVATIRQHTPPEFQAILDAAAADLRVTPDGFAVEDINALDAWYYDQCEVPLFAGSAHLDTLCRGSRVCVRPVVQAVLGGVCFEEAAPVGSIRTWTLLSCISGLPA